MNKKKGISQIVSVILIIMITVTIAAVTFSWIMSTMKEPIILYGKNIELVCSDVEFKADYNLDTKNLQFENGNIPIYDFNIEIFDSSAKKSKTREISDETEFPTINWPSYGLQSGKTENYNIDFGGNINKIVISPILRGVAKSGEKNFRCDEIYGKEIVIYDLCGDAICSTEENCFNCPVDCGCDSGYCCSEGICVTPGYCFGNNICSNGEILNHCGNGMCDCGETILTCSDCKKINGQNSTNNTECLSGFSVDGVCCNSICTEICKSCNITGYLGICTNDLYGTTCGTNKSCDGNGSCINKKENGETCNLGGECLSGYCIDGYCCNSKCTETCKSCNITGNLGICTNNLYGTKLTGCNIDYQQCDGYGNCIDWKWVELPTYGYNYCAIYGLRDCADCYGSWKTCNPSLEGTTAWHPYIYGMLSPDFAGYINWIGNLTGSTNLCSHFLATNYPTGYNSSTFFSCSKIIVESVTEPSEATCTADNQCESNICGTDYDNDGYFSLALGHTGTCQTSLKPYTDCYDLNANAKPGQIFYFDTNRGDGSFDYNCDNIEDDNGGCFTINSCLLSGTCLADGTSTYLEVGYGSYLCGESFNNYVCSFTSTWGNCEVHTSTTTESLDACSPCGGISDAGLSEISSSTCSCR